MPEEQAIAKKPEVALTKRGFAPTTMDEAYRFAQGLARSSFVPQQYRGKPDDCFIALDLAARMNVHWMAIMQHVYIVHGRPGIDANLAIGMVNQSRQFEPIQYEVEGDDVAESRYRVRAYSRRVGSAIVLKGPWIDWKLVKAEKWDQKEGSKWKTMPEQMFHYRAGSWWQKRHCPEMTLGMSTIDELDDAGEGGFKQVASTTLEPTEGRESFGFQKDAEQEPAGEAGQEEQQPAEGTPGKKCFLCHELKTNMTRQQCADGKNHLVCQECNRPTPSTGTGQEGEPKDEPAKEPQKAPAPVAKIDPERQVTCDNGHTFPFKVAVYQDEIPVCPDCGGFINLAEDAKDAGATELPGTLTCPKGHAVARQDIIPSILASKPGQIGKCPVCAKQDIATIIKEV